MRRGLIDYRMRRRSLLGEVASGARGPDEVCDAHPELLRAAQHLGDPVDEPCPLCDDAALRHVTYIFEGDRRRNPGGRAVPHASLPRQFDRYGELEVYIVEVCIACRWHHLLESFLLTDPATDVSTG